MDYGKRAPDLGWRMTDAWLSMAGEADVGIPNGRPVDEWGIRMEKGSATRSAPRCRAAAAPTARRRSTPSPSGTSGCGSTRLRAPPTSTSTSRCRRSRRATSPSRSSGTRPSPLRWWPRRDRATTPSTTRACRSGAWRRRRTARTGRKARSAAIRTWVPGRCSTPRRSIAARRPGSTPSSSSPRRWTSRRARSV